MGKILAMERGLCGATKFAAKFIASILVHNASDLDVSHVADRGCGSAHTIK